jgi:hypothetical protein
MMATEGPVFTSEIPRISGVRTVINGNPDDIIHYSELDQLASDPLVYTGRQVRVPVTTFLPDGQQVFDEIVAGRGHSERSIEDGVYLTHTDGHLRLHAGILSPESWQSLHSTRMLELPPADCLTYETYTRAGEQRSPFLNAKMFKLWTYNFFQGTPCPGIPGKSYDLKYISLKWNVKDSDYYKMLEGLVAAKATLSPLITREAVLEIWHERYGSINKIFPHLIYSSVNDRSYGMSEATAYVLFGKEPYQGQGKQHFVNEIFEDY